MVMRVSLTDRERKGSTTIEPVEVLSVFSEHTVPPYFVERMVVIGKSGKAGPRKSLQRMQV